MVLAVLLQIVGLVLFVVAVFLLLNARWAVLAAAAALFLAGYVLELGKRQPAPVEGG